MKLSYKFFSIARHKEKALQEQKTQELNKLLKELGNPSGVVEIEAKELQRYGLCQSTTVEQAPV